MIFHLHDHIISSLGKFESIKLV